MTGSMIAVARLHVAVGPARGSAATRTARLRTTRGSWRSTRSPSGRSRRSGPARARPTRGALTAGPGAPASRSCAAATASAFSRRAAASASSVPKTAEPATIQSAPAATTSRDRCARRCRRPPRWAPGCRLVEQRAHRPYFGRAARDEGLAAEPGIHRHDEHEVDVGRHFLEAADRRRRVQRDAGLAAPRLLMSADRPVQVGQHLDVDRDQRRRRPRRTPECSDPGPRSSGGRRAAPWPPA